LKKDEAEEEEESLDSFGFKKMNKAILTPKQKFEMEAKEKAILYEIE